MGEALAGQDLSWDLGYWVRPEGSWSQQRKNSRVDTGGLGEAKQRPSKAKRKKGESTLGGGGRQGPKTSLLLGKGVVVPGTREGPLRNWALCH
jgi:hypothetical protein